MRISSKVINGILIYVTGVVSGLAFFSLEIAPAFLQAKEETRLVYANLLKPNGSPQAREYFKARFYANMARWIPRGYYPEFRIDHGPVDDKLLGDFIAIKGPDSTAEMYELALKKHK